MSKISYGLSDCYCAVKNNGDYSKPFKMKGAVNLSVQSDGAFTTRSIRTRFGAIDYPIGYKNNTCSGKFEIASLPVEFLIDVLGYKQDKNGILIQSPHRAVTFALLFQTKANDDPTRYSYVNCVCKPPDFNATTIADTVSVNTKILDLLIFPDIDTGNYCKSISKSNNAEIFEDWFNKVY